MYKRLFCKLHQLNGMLPKLVVSSRREVGPLPSELLVGIHDKVCWNI